ncbi:hypothetical protein L228DRAFT_243785 [Xylona heveae TC161]|uniref:Transcription factor Rba50 n=1 Tax=Xylona heveae (strain CBS 132557 / TC161) TaxID=1328760 RepID=A0A161TFY7_XYLHT|nr:hypothetical protein L228DRAFT_243785 [Xylona heveae TC161]KZF25007.1 hypothetical protein L228DRAFT_243785 [Xylona heveae TC161]
MVSRGERFHVDLPSDSEEEAETQAGSAVPPPLPLSLGFVSDIKEREPAAPKPPAPPSLTSTKTGFPEHKKRTRVSAFKQRRAAAPNGDASTVSSGSQAPAKSTVPVDDENASFEENDRRRINEENDQRLAAMSDAEIAQEREELMAGMNPSLLEMFLKKARIDESHDGPQTRQEEEPPENKSDARPRSSKKVTFDDEPSETAQDSQDFTPIPSSSSSTPPTTAGPDPDSITPTSPPPDLHPANAPPRHNSQKPDTPSSSSPNSNLTDALPPGPSVHFPRPPSPPALDPNSPSFLDDLHSKYFPSLPSDPSKLQWMSEPSAPESTSYSPDAESFTPSALRFGFTGALLPPRVALEIPTTKGLHHHGNAPASAGYTIPELAHLSRSSFPTQRCIAYQTLGRILYRLGIGEYGDEESDLSNGLWQCIEQGRVIDSLVAEADGRFSAHVSAQAHAQEAVWLWRKGGGRRWKAA